MRASPHVYASLCICPKQRHLSHHVTKLLTACAQNTDGDCRDLGALPIHNSLLQH